jgi:hypothetical protein
MPTQGACDVEHHFPAEKRLKQYHEIVFCKVIIQAKRRYPLRHNQSMIICSRSLAHRALFNSQPKCKVESECQLTEVDSEAGITAVASFQTHVPAWRIHRR